MPPNYEPINCGDHCSCIHLGNDDGDFKCCDCQCTGPCKDEDCGSDRCEQLRQQVEATRDILNQKKD